MISEASAGAQDLGEVTLPGGVSLPMTARATVDGWLEGRVADGALADARLLVSELVTNSFVHSGESSGAPVRIRAKWAGEDVWVEVADGGFEGAVEQRAVTADQRGGFGLQLVDRIAERWGVTHDAGTQVWFLLAHEPSHAA